MAPPTVDRWRALCQRLGARSSGDDWWQRLREAHGTPPRAYHDLSHVGACLESLDQLTEETHRADIVELALWFHDAVYDPRARDNEARSAALAHEAAEAIGLDTIIADTVSRLVMVTKHRREPQDGDERVIIDADLSILGSAPRDYARYERSIRREYDFVPESEYRVARAAVLRRFLEREWIYWTSSYRERREARARSNLTSAHSALGGLP